MKWYKLVFKQEQPIHLGALKWGVVNETEIFIPGWTMWGALTSFYLKQQNIFQNQDKSKNVKEMVPHDKAKAWDVEQIKRMFEHITNFYPALCCGESEEILSGPLFPHYEKGRFYLGDYSEEKFKFEFVDTMMSTAIEPVSRRAKDEQLHELEYILPTSKARPGTEWEQSRKIYWVGLIGFDDEMVQEALMFLKGFPKIYVGGDTRYGFGLLKLSTVEELDCGYVKKENKERQTDDELNKSKKQQGKGEEYEKVEQGEELKLWGLDEDGCLCWEDEGNNLFLKQFLEFSPEIKFEGEIKLIAEFDFGQNTPRVQTAGYYVNVGSKIKIDNELDNNMLKRYCLYKGKFILC